MNGACDLSTDPWVGGSMQRQPTPPPTPPPCATPGIEPYMSKIQLPRARMLAVDLVRQRHLLSNEAPHRAEIELCWTMRSVSSKVCKRDSTLGALKSSEALCGPPLRPRRPADLGIGIVAAITDEDEGCGDWRSPGGRYGLFWSGCRALVGLEISVSVSM